MFGYIKPFKPELKICEFEAYKSVYCGLCGELGKQFTPLARLTLSYDFAFLSMLYFSLTSDFEKPQMRRCYVNPLKKTPCAKSGEPLVFSANIATIMLYYKLIDNIDDSGFFKSICWRLLKPFASHARKKAASLYLEADEIIDRSIRAQREIEGALSGNLDEAAEPTALAMSRIFALLPCDERQSRILSRLGYFIGRFVYICDALDDLEGDVKSGGYNPLAMKFPLSKSGLYEIDSARDFARESLYMTIGEAVKAYDLLEKKAYKPVLDNIVNLGLRAAVEEIISRKAVKS